MLRILSFSALTTLLAYLPATAQWSLVVSAGVSPQQSPGTPYIFVNRSTPRNEFTFDLAQVKSSPFIGAGAEYRFAPFFVNAEAQYTRREYVYDVTGTYPGFPRSAETTSYTQSTDLVNLPLTLGVNLGVIDVTSGFLPQFVVSSRTDLDQIEGYSEDRETMRLGWHGGVAARLTHLRIGLSYQMDFHNYGDHMAVNGDPLRLQGRSSRLMGSISYIF
jgi:hypothetical protein